MPRTNSRDGEVKAICGVKPAASNSPKKNCRLSGTFSKIIGSSTNSAKLTTVCFANG